jgi:hypothetical protein
VDLSKFKTSDWLKIGGGVAVLFFAFIAFSGDVKEIAGIKVGDGDCDLGCPGGLNMLDFFFTGTVPWLLLIAIAILTFLGAAGIFKLPSTFPAPIVFLAAAALSTLLILIRVLMGPKAGYAGVDVVWGRGFGMFIVLLGAIAVLVGCVQGFKESGGDLNDLKDMNKLKGQFTGSGESAPPPPPPPPGATPPPPPPPPAG